MTLDITHGSRRRQGLCGSLRHVLCLCTARTLGRWSITIIVFVLVSGGESGRLQRQTDSHIAEFSIAEVLLQLGKPGCRHHGGTPLRGGSGRGGHGAVGVCLVPVLGIMKMIS